MKSTSLWHGRTYREIVEAWDSVPWRGAIYHTLLEVAACRHAAAEDRLSALTLLNNAINAEILPTLPQYPEILRDVMLLVAADSRVGWFRGRTRRRMSERLVGARAMLQMVHQFQAIVAEDAAPDPKTSKPDALLS
jgi:hypothetical protein